MNKIFFALLIFFGYQNIFGMDNSAVNEEVEKFKKGLTSSKVPKMKLNSDIFNQIKENSRIALEQKNPSKKESAKIKQTTTTKSNPPSTAVKKKASAPSPAKKKKNTSQDNLDEILAAFKEKDTKSHSNSPLKNKHDESTLVLDPEQDASAINFFDVIKNSSKLKCICCQQKKCDSKRKAVKKGIVSYSDKSKFFQVTALSSGKLSFNDAENNWSFIAQPAKDSWQLQFSCDHTQKNKILEHLNQSIEDSSSDDSYTSEHEEEEESEDFINPEDNFKLIINPLKDSGKNKVIIDIEDNRTAEWADKNKTKVIYAKNGRHMMILDAKSGEVID